MFVFRKFGVLCFLETAVLRLALLPCYWRSIGNYTKFSTHETMHQVFLEKGMTGRIEEFYILS